MTYFGQDFLPNYKPDYKPYFMPDFKAVWYSNENPYITDMSVTYYILSNNLIINNFSDKNSLSGAQEFFKDYYAKVSELKW